MTYIDDFAVDSTVPIHFTTNAANGGKVDPSDPFDLADIRIYKGTSATQRTSTSGWTISSPFDTETGAHALSIDLSDNTDAGFYAAGNDYFVYLIPDTETVDTQSVASIIGHFSIENRNNNVNVESWSAILGTNDDYPATQQQVGQIATGSSAISTVADSYVLTTGTQSSGTYTDTHTVNGVYHEHTDTAGALDLYYEYDVTGAGVGSSATIIGRINGSNDSLDGIYAWNWSGSTWDRVGDFAGQSSTTDIQRDYNLTTAHTGTGVNLGKIRIRFYAAAGLTTATLFVDQILVSYAVVSQTVGYANGAIWIDTTSGTAGTEPYVNGVADNPVDTLANALTIASTLGMDRFHLSNDSSITFASSQANNEFMGSGWTLNLGGQAIDNVHVVGALDVSGTGTSATDAHFDRCEFLSATLGIAHLTFCGLGATITLTTPGTVTFDNCYSKIPGAASPTVDLGAGVGAVSLNIRKYDGGLILNNVEAGDTVTVGGTLGTVTVNGSGGVVEVRGTYKAIVDNRTGGTPVNTDGAVKGMDVESILEDTSVTIPAQIDGLAIAKNQAFNNFTFLVVLSSDHVSPATGKTIAGEKSIDGGAFSPVSGPITEVGRGYYQFDADASDTNGDIITWVFSNGDTDDSGITFKTIP